MSRARRRCSRYTAVSVFFVATISAFGQCGSLAGPSTSWILAGTGNFTTAANWSNGVPTNLLNVCISNGTSGTTSTANLGGVNQSVLNLEVDANNTLNINNAASLLVYGSQIINGGAINLAAGANPTVLGLTGNTTVSGTGAVTLSGGANAIINQQVAGLTLTNQSTIQGAGVIGNGGGLALNNQGTVNANVSAGTLTLNGTGGVTNSGILEATNNGILLISGTTVNNTSGSAIGSSGGGVVQIGGSMVLQGTLTLSGTVETQPGGTAILDGTPNGGLTITSGTYLNPNNSTLQVRGTIVNNGAINLTAGANNSLMRLTANTTLNGTGTVNLSSTGAGLAYIDLLNTNGGQVLTIGPQMTIQGGGEIGDNGLSVVNQGLIQATIVGQPLFIGGASGNAVVVNNQGGNITGNGGTITLFGAAVIQGGTLNGTLATFGGNTGVLDGVTNGALTLASGAVYTDPNASNLFVKGNLVNNGTIAVTAGGNATVLGLTGNTTLSGTGAITLSGGANAIINQQVAGLTLTNQSTIQGAGVIGNGGGLALNNQGTVNANVSA